MTIMPSRKRVLPVCCKTSLLLSSLLCALVVASSGEQPLIGYYDATQTETLPVEFYKISRYLDQRREYKSVENDMKIILEMFEVRETQMVARRLLPKGFAAVGHFAQSGGKLQCNGM